MPLTKEQEIYIQNYVYLMVDYRETYEELSDHLISALGDLGFQEERQLQDALVRVIDEDLGGSYNIIMKERERAKHLVSHLGKQHLKEFFMGFLRPWIWLAIVLVFFLGKVATIHISALFLYRSCIIMMVLPTLVFGAYKLITWKQKKSIKEMAVFNMAFLLLNLVQLVILLFNEVLMEAVARSNDVYVITVLVMLIYVFSISVIRFMNREIQVLQRLIAA